MEYCNKPAGICASLALTASLALHASLFLLSPGSDASGHQTTAPLRVRIATAALRVQHVQALVRPPAVQASKPMKPHADGARTMQDAPKETPPVQEVTAVSAPVQKGFLWTPTAAPERAAVADPVQAAMQARRRQYQMQAIAMAMSDVALQLSTQVTGDNLCRQQPDLRIQCDYGSNEAWTGLLAQWLELVTQARSMGMASAEQELNGTNGRLVVHLL